MFRRLSKLFFLILRNAIDTSNFSQYPDSGTEVIALKNDKDPFLSW